MSKYDVNEIRKKLKQSQAGKFTDPDQFKPDKGKSKTEAIKYRFYVLPPILKGDILKSGVVEKSMEQFFIQHANHWINDRPYACPRVWGGDDICKVCDFGFDLLREEENKEEERRRKIVKQWMPTTYNAVNIYFTNWKGNPEELRNKVKWYNSPQTCFAHWSSTMMKENAGDPEDPEAYGVFFDENAGFIYELQVLLQGRQNSYKTSKFLPNGGKGMPMVKNKDDSPNEKGLATLLRLRHNLWDKIDIPDITKIDKVFAVMTDGDDLENSGGGFDQDENTAVPKDDTPKDDTPKDDTPKDDTPKDDTPKDDDRDVVDSLAEADEVPTSDDGPSDDNSPNDADSLADEQPLDSSSDDSQAPAPEPAAVTSGGDDVGGDEIDDLLSQLDDDD